MLRYKLDFTPFPNYHIRTNAFLLARDVLLRVNVGKLDNKRDAEKFESGRKSLTRQIFAMNLRALVVGRDGRAYEEEDWYESRTFRSGEQQNLLVADNRTTHYMSLDAETRKSLSDSAWRTT